MSFDERARASARTLRDQVRSSTDTELALGRALGTRSQPPPRRRAPLVSALALMALLVGVGVRANLQRDGDLDVELRPDPEAAPLRLLGPDDGRQSVRLSVVVEPATGLRDGATVIVESEGFQPGESVGIVQCGAESGVPGRLGSEACDIGRFEQAAADADGRVSASFTVARVLTTPATGTVDCASQPERCLIGVGAIIDYDRSGGARLTFEPSGNPVELPSLVVSTTDQLAAGQLVDVSGSGFDPDDGMIGLEVCSTDPVVCHATGDESLGDDAFNFSGPYAPSLVIEADGTVAGSVALWRFLPGPEPGTYVDCAVSACVVRARASVAPPPEPLAFAGDEVTPTAPAIAVAPSGSLRSGDRVAVAGTGFIPQSQVWMQLCASPPASASPAPGQTLGSTPRELCASDDGGGVALVDDNGRFEMTMRLSSFEDYQQCTGPSGDCDVIEPDASWSYTIVVTTGSRSSSASSAPVFDAEPIPVAYEP